MTNHGAGNGPAISATRLPLSLKRQEKQGPTAFFIAGDLFHRQPLQKDLKRGQLPLFHHPGVRVIIIAGNHDRIRLSSAVLSFSWCPNVTFIDSEELTSYYFRDINTEVTGFSYHTAEITEPRLNQAYAPHDGRIHILIGHGGDLNHTPIDKAALADSGFSYIALGHIHKPEVLIERKMAYCGSPEPLDKTETGAHGIFYGEINPSTLLVTKLEFIPMSKLRYIPLIVNVTLPQPIRSYALKCPTRLTSAELITSTGSGTGNEDPDITFDLDSLLLRYKISDILDESEPEYDFSALFAEHPSDMIGFYIRALQKPDMSPVEKRRCFTESMPCFSQPMKGVNISAFSGFIHKRIW